MGAEGKERTGGRLGRKVLSAGREALAQRAAAEEPPRRRGGMPGQFGASSSGCEGEVGENCASGTCERGDATRGCLRRIRCFGGMWNHLTLPEPSKANFEL